MAHREEWFQAEPQNGDAKSYLAEAHLWLGTACWHLGENDASQDHFRKALAYADQLVAAFPDKFDLRADVADIFGQYCDAKLRMGLEEHARIACGRAMEYIESALAHNPDRIFRQPLLALTHERQALLAARAGDASQAREHYEQARKVRVELLEIEPNNVSWRAALTLAHCGQTADAATHAAEVAQRSPESAGLLLQVARCYATCAAAAEPDERRRFQELALEAACLATAGDFRDPVLVRTDPELALLADLPQFAELLAQLKPALTPAP